MVVSLDKSAPLGVPFRAVLASVVGVWAVYFVLITARGDLIGMEFDADLLWRRTFVCAIGVAVTLILWLILRLFDHRRTWVAMIAAMIIAMPAAMIIAQVNQFLFAPIQEQLEDKFAEERGVALTRDEAGNLFVEIPQPRQWQYDGTEGEGEKVEERQETIRFTLREAPKAGERWLPLVDAALSRYYILLTWSGLYLAMLAIGQARAAERREQEFRSAAKAAELRSLRYQVNPHFLFNTLNSLSALVMTGKADRAERMIQTISRFYRHSLADDPTSDVPLKDEFDLQKLYLDIEAVRFPERLVCKFELPEELADARVPGMILQPLVENSVKYAVSAVNRPVTITVAAREEFDRLVITVADDGPPHPEHTKHGFGIGLANVRDRLEARFGSDILMTSNPVEGGYRTEIRVPLTRHG